MRNLSDRFLLTARDVLRPNTDITDPTQASRPSPGIPTLKSVSTGQEGWFAAMAGLAGDAERYQTLMGEVFARADDLIGSYIAILSVFVFRIVILPLLVLGAFFVLARGLAQRPSG